MAAPLVDASGRVYRLMLGAYPAAFRRRYADEMAQVFRALCREAYKGSGAGGLARLWAATGWDWAGAVLYQWWLRIFARKGQMMDANRIELRDGVRPLSTAQVILAVLPFLMFGLGSLVAKWVGNTQPVQLLPDWLTVVIHPYTIFYAFVLIGLAAGIFMGFPRWAFSYLGCAVLFALWWSGVQFNGVWLGGWTWLALLLAILFPLLARRTFQPLRALAAGLWQDWTLPSLLIFTLYGALYMIYDENHHPLLLAFVAATTLAVSLGAWGYFRATNPLLRVLALFGGLVVAVILETICNATWDYRAYYRLPEGEDTVNLIAFFFLAVLAIIMLGNGLLARWRLRRRAQTGEKTLAR
jgi:hypothetical protein